MYLKIRQHLFTIYNFQENTYTCLIFAYADLPAICWMKQEKIIDLYEVCPESKGTKVLTIYNFFNLRKRQCE
jgi:hypothetical protein